MNTHLDTRIPQPPLDDQHRQRLRVAVWAVLGGSSLALAGIFGFGALTGAGDYFSDDEAEQAAALAEHYWQIWGLLLPVAIAIVFSGVALFMFAGSLAPITEGWRATVVTWIRRVIVPLAVVASMPYWFGPELDELGMPGWVEAVTASCGILAYAATVMLGVAMLVRPLPTWTGIAMIVGGILAAVSFLPLFAFAGTLLAGMGLLRWSRPTSAVIAPAMGANATT